MTAAAPLDRIVIVLWETQDRVNVAGTIRAMKNFGLSRLRLVSPVEFDPHRLEGIAHGTADLIESAELYDSLPDALADCSLVVAMTARERRAKRAMDRPRSLAPELLQRAADPEAGPVAILFGREDHGLPNWALDLCHRTVSIPTNPEHRSLNLAQAVLVMCYELWMEAEAAGLEFKPPRHDAPPANVEQLEGMFGDVQAALEAIEFFKSRTNESVMRTLREIGYRSDLDAREAGFVRAVAREVVHFMERTGRKQ